MNRLLILIHELIHVNIVGNHDDLFDDTNLLSPLKETQTEAVNWLVVQMIINQIAGDKKDDFLKELKNFAESNERNKKIFSLVKELGEKWNLSEKPLMKWIKSS